MSERTDHPPVPPVRADAPAPGHTARRAILGGALGLALLIGPVALAAVVLPTAAATIRSRPPETTQNVAHQRPAPHVQSNGVKDGAHGPEAHHHGATHDHHDRAPYDDHHGGSPPPTTEEPTAEAPPPAENTPATRQQRRARRPQQLRHVGRTGRVRVGRRLAHQHRQRLLRRPAVLARLLASGGRHGLPHENSRETQITMGQRLYASSGWGAWPSCTAQLGWR